MLALVVRARGKVRVRVRDACTHKNFNVKRQTGWSIGCWAGSQGK